MPRKVRALPFVACATLLACGAATPVAGADKPSVKQSTEQLDRVRSRIQSLNQTLQADRGRQDELQTALTETEKAVTQAEDASQRLAADIERQNARLRLAQQRRDEAQRKLKSQKDALAAQLRAAYLIGGGGRTGLVLNQDDPGRAARMVAYYDYLNAARAQRIADIQSQIHQIAELEKQVETEAKSLQDLQAERRRALADLQARRAERAQAVSDLRKRIASEGDELKTLQANEKQIQALLEQLKRSMLDTPFEGGDSRPFPQLRGKLPWPLKGPLLANYGQAKAEGRLQWKGVWIGAEEGSAIHACARGRVAYVGWMSRYGLIVVLEHEGGYFTLYGHAATVTKTAGEIVQPGDVVATAGNTGGYEQPGLYFEIRKGTEPVNPRDWLRN